MSPIALVLALVLSALIAMPAPASARTTGDVTVFAAASLADALQEAVAAHVRQGGARPRLSFAASSTLARQIEAGARADMFVSADEEWMDHVEKRGFLAPGSRRTLAGNRLALVVPADRPLRLDLTAGAAWLAELPAGRIATGDPAHVPAGRYARQALTRLGVWSAVESRLARADNVRAAMVLVERGEAVAGIVYATDAMRSRRVAVAGVFPETAHTSIVYPVAMLKDASGAAVRAFYDFLASPEAAAILARHGFSAP